MGKVGDDISGSQESGRHQESADGEEDQHRQQAELNEAAAESE